MNTYKQTNKTAKPYKEQPEFKLQCQVCEYIKLQYPKVRFFSDTIAFVKLTLPQQMRNKKIQCDGFKMPDIVIFATRVVDGERFSGLLIELKSETPYKKDGFLKSNEHIKAQSNELDNLASDGYFSTFAWSFDVAKIIIDKYLKSPKDG
jgi:hypothetical protein